MSSRASVCSQVSPFGREVAQGGGRWNGKKEKEMQTFTSGEDTTPRAYFTVQRKACVFVCVRGQERGGVSMDAFSINYSVPLPTAQVSLHLQQHN